MFDHLLEDGGRDVCGEVDVFRLPGAVQESRLVKPFHDCVDSHSVFGIPEAVLFGGNEQNAGSVLEFQTFDSRVAAGNPPRLDHFAQVGAQRVRFGVPEQIVFVTTFGSLLSRIKWTVSSFSSRSIRSCAWTWVSM